LLLDDHLAQPGEGEDAVGLEALLDDRLQLVEDGRDLALGQAGLVRDLRVDLALARALAGGSFLCHVALLAWLCGPDAPQARGASVIKACVENVSTGSALVAILPMFSAIFK